MTSFLDPAILFFIFGVLAGMVRSNLEIPTSIAKFLALYLLMALGLKGGFALANTGFSVDVMVSLGAAAFMASIVPLLAYAFLKRYVSLFDAAAIAASYGSVSAVTFVTAIQVLENHHMPAGGHMAAALVIMESPAILVAVFLANSIRAKLGGAKPKQVPSNRLTHYGFDNSDLIDPTLDDADQSKTTPTSLKNILHESFTDGAQLLLLGAMVVGYITGEAGRTVMQPFSGDLFKGMLAFFLLDMGLLVARNFKDAIKAPPLLLVYALLAPWLHAGLALLLGHELGMPLPDTVLLMVLSASASYIVVPAVLRHAIPEANPGLYLGLSLGVTFPMNIMLGIPSYLAIALWVLS